jgi:hypothetical protein
MKSLLFSFLLITCIIGIIQAVCPKDPSEWCKTVEAASECDVISYSLYKALTKILIKFFIRFLINV